MAFFTGLIIKAQFVSLSAAAVKRIFAPREGLEICVFSLSRRRTKHLTPGREKH
jgi:hypothetical protein